MSFSFLKSNCQLCRECRGKINQKFFYALNYKDLKNDILKCLPKCQKCQRSGNTSEDRIEGMEAVSDLNLKEQLLLEKVYPSSKVSEEDVSPPDKLRYMESGEMEYEQAFRNYDKESEWLENKKRLNKLRS